MVTTTNSAMTTRIKTPFPEISCQFPPSNEEIGQLQLWIDELKQKKINVRSHLRLFVYEAIQHMTEQEYHALVQIFADDKRDRINLVYKDALRRAENEGKTGEQAQAQAMRTIKGDLFKHVSYSKQANALYYLLAIVARCRDDDDPQAYAELHLNGLKSVEYYARFFGGRRHIADRVSYVLEPKWIIKYFRNRNVAEYDLLLKRVDKLYVPHKPGRREIEAAACLFIRGLVHCTDVPDSTREIGDWYYDFLEACLTHGDTRFLPRLIEPNYKEELEEYRAKKIVGPATLLDDKGMLELLIDDAQPTEARSQQDYIRYRVSNIEDYEPETYILRAYQNELIIHANSGKNTIICAPTGSGKTLLAVDIIKNHLEKQHKDGKVGRCLMLVPTVPLVDQQTLHFLTYLGAYRDYSRPDLPYWIDGFSGCENISEGRANRLLASDICVMTPQILINMMNSILRSERVYFADFSLIIFDECHHCHQRHPYKMLMEMLENAGLEAEQRPQIVGLTASMGVGDTSMDINACKQHMLTLCSNLMADTISTVRHQLENLKSHVQPPVDLVEKVQRPKVDTFFECIDKLMKRIEKHMTAELQKLIDDQTLKIITDQINFPPHTDQARYQTMVGTLKKHVQRIQNNVELRFLLVRSIDHLSHYFHAILISDLLPNVYGLKYLDEKMSNYNKSAPAVNSADVSGINQINMDLLNLYERLRRDLVICVERENIQEKEILGKLHTILYEQFEKEPDSRCLIFVATRNCAQKLSDHLMRVPELPMFYEQQNVGFMVSCNQSCSVAGQSGQEQQKMRNDFDAGRIKVLVVTSVAEEGVNIAACNLIIKYNNVGSERSMIQRRGRARQKNSRSILLALDNYIEKAEYINMQKEAIMMRCIEDLQEQSESALKQKILEKRQELAKIRNEQEKIKEQKQNLLNGRRYKLNCRSCGNLICSSTYIRCIPDSNFVVCDGTVWQRSNMVLRIQASKNQLTTKCARWQCGKCITQDWGTVIKYSNVYLPQLNAGTFTMQREDGTEAIEDTAGSRRTWKRIQEEFFNVDPINPRNIKEMYSALKKAMPELIQQMDVNEVIANQQFIDTMKEKMRERKNRVQMFLDE